MEPSSIHENKQSFMEPSNQEGIDFPKIGLNTSSKELAKELSQKMKENLLNEPEEQIVVNLLEGSLLGHLLSEKLEIKEPFPQKSDSRQNELGKKDSFQQQQREISNPQLFGHSLLSEKIDLNNSFQQKSDSQSKGMSCLYNSQQNGRGQHQVSGPLSSEKIETSLPCPQNLHFAKENIIFGNFEHSKYCIDDFSKKQNLASIRISSKLEFYHEIQKFIINHPQYLDSPIAFIRTLFEKAIQDKDQLKLKALTLFVGENLESVKIDSLGLAHDTKEYKNLIEETYQTGDYFMGNFLISIWRTLQPEDIVQMNYEE